MATDGTLSYAVTLANRGFLGPAGQVQQGIGRMTGGMGRMLGPLAAAAAGAAGLAGGIAGLGKAIGAAANMEQMMVSFEVMLGSGEKAKKMLKDIEAMGSATPYEFPALAEGGKVLLNFGIEAEKVLPTLKMLGDIGGGDAQKMASLTMVFGQIASTGRLMGQDLLQLINVGFNPLQEIAKKTGEDMATLKQRMEKGGVSFAEVEEAFRAATSEGGRFHGMMEKQSKTTLGLLSTLKDNIGQVFRTLGEPINDILGPMLEKAIEKTKEFGETLKSMIAVVRGAIAEGKLGEMIAMALKVGLMEGANFGLGAIQFLAEAGGKMLGFVFRQVFGDSGKLLVTVVGQLPTMIGGVAKIIQAQLGSGFANAAAHLVAGLEFGKQKGLEMVGAIVSAIADWPNTFRSLVNNIGWMLEDMFERVAVGFEAGLRWTVATFKQGLAQIPGLAKLLGIEKSGDAVGGFQDFVAAAVDKITGSKPMQGIVGLQGYKAADYGSLLEKAKADLDPKKVEQDGKAMLEKGWAAMGAALGDFGPKIVDDLKATFGDMSFEMADVFDSGPIKDALGNLADSLAPEKAGIDQPAEKNVKQRPPSRIRMLGESLTDFWREQQGAGPATRDLLTPRASRGVAAKAAQLTGGKAATAAAAAGAAGGENKLAAYLAKIEQHTRRLESFAVA